MERPDATRSKCQARILRKRKLSGNERKDVKIQKIDDTSPKQPISSKTYESSPSSSLSSQESIKWPSFNRLTDKRLIRFNNPLPDFTWTDSFGMWKSMIARELHTDYSRDWDLFEQNPFVQERMRAVLLDWLNEVCEVYKMQRKSLYMSIDYVDRYLSRVSGVQKRSLQLIGVAALFISSKCEEIYPPNLSEFSFITDGACSTQDILSQELDIIQVLQWKLSPVTPVCWLGLLLQVLCHEGGDILSIHFKQNLFVNICRLIDLCMLSSESLNFSYFNIAIAAISFFIHDHKVLPSIIALSSQHRECRRWLKECYRVLTTSDHNNTSSDDSNHQNNDRIHPNSHPDFEKFPVMVSRFSNIPDHSSHTIQTHLTSLEQMDEVQKITTARTTDKQPSPESPSSPRKPPQNPTKNPLTSSSNLPIEVLTPPKSIELKQKSGQSLVGVVDPEVLSVKYIDLNST